MAITLCRCLRVIPLLLLAACGGGGETDSGLTIACAASLRPVVEEAAAVWNARHPGNPVAVTCGASGALFAQLTQQAPFDLFLAADTEYPRRLVAAGHAAQDFTYAAGRLALWVPRDSGLDPVRQGVNCLRDPRVRKVAIAHPQLAPYGRAALAVLAYYGLEECLKDRLVLAEHAGQAAQFVQSGAAQAGLIALSLALTPEMRAAGLAWTVPEAAHERLRQSGAVLSRARHREAAERFRDWLCGAEGRVILERHGLTPP